MNCSGIDCLLLYLNFKFSEYIWIIFIVFGLYFLFRAYKDKIYIINVVFALILFFFAYNINPTVISKRLDAQIRTQVTDAINEQPKLLKSLDFTIYIPTYLPPIVKFTTWDVVKRDSGVTDLQLTYDFTNEEKIDNEFADKLVITMYKDDGYFNPPKCGLYDHYDIEVQTEGLSQYRCPLVLITPSGKKVYWEESVGNEDVSATPNLTPGNQSPYDASSNVDRIFVKLGSTVITFDVNLEGPQFGTGLTMDELSKFVDSFTETNPDTIIQQISVQKRINTETRNYR